MRSSLRQWLPVVAAALAPLLTSTSANTAKVSTDAMMVTASTGFAAASYRHYRSYWDEERYDYAPIPMIRPAPLLPAYRYYPPPPTQYYYGPPAYDVLPPPRPSSCGQFHYWDGDRCADARFDPPYIGPRW